MIHPLWSLGTLWPLLLLLGLALLGLAVRDCALLSL